MRSFRKLPFDIRLGDNANAVVHRREGFGIDGSCAPGYEDTRNRIYGKRMMDGLSGFLVCLGCDRACVDDNLIGCLFGNGFGTLPNEGSLNRVRLNTVYFAAEVYDMKLS